MEFAFAVAMLGGFKKALESRAIKIFAAEPNGLDLCGVVNVSEGVGAEKHKVSELAGCDGTEVRGAAEKFRGTQCAGLKRREGRKAGFDE